MTDGSIAFPGLTAQGDHTSDSESLSAKCNALWTEIKFRSCVSATNWLRFVVQQGGLADMTMSARQQLLARGLVSLLFLALLRHVDSLAQNTANPCDWGPGGPHKMHWPQPPDPSPAGVDIDATAVMFADDFKCTATGPITRIHIWGSFADDIVPQNGPGGLNMTLSIYTDDPARDGRAMGNIFYARSVPDGTTFGKDVMVDAVYTDTSQ